MAKPPVADASMMEEDAGAAPAEAPATDDMAEDMESDESGTVLLTVCKEADGSFRLIKGDEEDAAPASAEGEEAPAEAEMGMKYDSKGALLKAILDVLNEGEEGEGEEGGEQSFQDGFKAETPAPPPGASPMAQKY